jgi:hypothetical protein
LSKAVTRLLRRGLQAPPGCSVQEDAPSYGNRHTDPRTGFPVRSFGRRITMEEVQQAIDDEDLRILEYIRRDHP